jgi:hypothetical protein
VKERSLRRSLVPAAALLLAASGGGAPDQPPANTANAAAAPTQPASASPLVGRWVASEPVRFASEEVRTETSEAEVEYRADGSFRYRARLSMAGGQIPGEGLSFRLDATGRWTLADAVLSERFDTVTVEPEARKDGNINLVAEALADEMKADAPSRAEVVELSPDRLVLRERESAQIVTYVREPSK